MPGVYGTPKPYRYSFSGADARAYAFYPGAEDQMVWLESMQTVSVSVHEAKGGARSLGYKSKKGFARGVRTIGGSIILTVIEDHPLRELVSIHGGLLGAQPSGWHGWSVDRSLMGTGTALNRFDMNNRLATLLPPFNLFVSFVSEGAQFSDRTLYTSDIRYGDTSTAPLVTSDGESLEQNVLGTAIDIPGASYMVEGIEIIDSGIVTSVHDVITEVSISFEARNFKPLSAVTFTSEEHNPLPADQQREAALYNRLYPQAPSSALTQYAAFQDKQIADLIQLGEDLGMSPEETQSQLIAAGLLEKY